VKLTVQFPPRFPEVRCVPQILKSSFPDAVTRKILAAAEAAIVSGATVVHDYMSDNSCPISVD
jgi:hypothetical protein